MLKSSSSVCDIFPLQIADNTYDALLCSAGMFPGSIVPQAFTELIRVVKPGGVIAWNIAEGYDGFNEFFKTYDEIYKQLIKDGKWEEIQPVKKLDNMLFEDAGYTYMMRKLQSLLMKKYLIAEQTNKDYVSFS